MDIQDRLNAIENRSVLLKKNKKEGLICSYCNNKDLTVDRNLFDGLCADCTDKALYNYTISEIAKKNNEKLKMGWVKI